MRPSRIVATVRRQPLVSSHRTITSVQRARISQRLILSRITASSTSVLSFSNKTTSSKDENNYTPDDIWRKRTESTLLTNERNNHDVTALLVHWTSIHTAEASTIAWQLYDHADDETVKALHLTRIVDHWRRCVVTLHQRLESPWSVWKRVVEHPHHNNNNKAVSILLYTLPYTARFYQERVLKSLFETIVEHLKESDCEQVIVWNSALKANVTLWPASAYEFYRTLPVSDGRSSAICMESIRDDETLATELYDSIPTDDTESRSFAFNHLLRIHPNYMQLFSNHDAQHVTKYMRQTVLSRLLKDDRLDEAVAICQQQQKSDELAHHSIHILISHLAKKDPQKAEYLLENARIHHPESINVLMDAWVNAGDLARAKRLLHDDTYAYTILMKGYSQQQKAHGTKNECLDLFHAMKERGITRTPATFATALTSIVKQRGSAEVAESIFRDYQHETQQPPTAFMFERMILIWSHTKSPNAALRAFAYYEHWRGKCLLDPSFPRPMPTTMRILLRQQASALSAHRLLQQVDADQRTRPMYHIVLNAWNQDNTPHRLSAMRELLDQMKQTSSCVPTTASYLFFLKALAKAGNGDLARKVLHHEIKDPDAYCYGVVIGAHPNHPTMAQALFDEMKKRSIPPNLFVYGNLLKIWVSNSHHPEAVDRAEAVYRDLKADENWEPGVWHMNRLMLMYASLGKVESARAYFDLICGEIDPQRAHYNVLLTAYQNSEVKPDIVHEATSLIRRMRQGNVRPDTITYTILLNTFRKNDVPFPEAKQLIEGMLRLAQFGETSAAPNCGTWHALLDYWSDDTPPHHLELAWIERVCNDEAILHQIGRIRESDS